MRKAWRDVAGYEGLYKVSNTGEVMSVDRVINGRFYEGRLLKQRLDKYGYVTVKLSKSGSGKDLKVHRLVAMAFISNPEGKPEINHKNEIKTCNMVWNLEWATTKENANHGSRLQRISEAQKGKPRNYAKGKGNYFYGKRFMGKDNVTSKKVYQYSIDGDPVGEYNCTREAGEAVGVCATAIGSCCRGKRKTSAGYIWRYTPLKS